MRTRSLATGVATLVALATTSFPISAQSPDQSLAPGQTVERRLAGGETHLYTLAVMANGYCDVVVDQRGIDVVVTLLAPDGAVVAEVDNPNGVSGPEPVEAVAAVAGTYVLKVAAPDAKAAAGDYAVQVKAIRAATPNDAPLVEARNGIRQAQFLLAARKPGEAIPLAERAVASFEKILGPDHPDLAEPLFRLADFYFQTQQFPKAEPIYERVLSIQRRTLEADDAAIGLTLNDLASVYAATGRELVARPLQEQVVAIYEKRHGPESVQHALALSNLGETYRVLGLFDRADAVIARALAIRERLFGPEHPRVALVLNNMGVLERDRGDFVRAETLLLRALAMREKALGPEHPEVAQSLTNLGELYRLKGDIDRAEQFTLRSLAIKEKALGPNNPSLALTLNNLAVLHLERGRFDKATEALERSLAIFEKVLGPGNPFSSVILNNLAGIARKAGRFDDAKALMARALPLEEKAFGKDHPRVANNLTNLGLIQRDAGEIALSLATFERVLAIREASLGPTSPEVATSLATVASLRLATGDLAGAIAAQKRAGDARERDFAYTLSAGSERQKLLYLDRTASELDGAISLHTVCARDSVDARRIAFEAVLRRKGRALDAMANTITSLRARASETDRMLLDELVEARAVLSTLSLRGPGRRPIEAYRAELDALRQRVDTLEEQVAARSVAFRLRFAPVTLDTVQAAVPVDSVLVEFASYRAYDAAKNALGERRYVAYVLRREGQPGWVDLGAAEPIDRAVDALRKAARNPNRTDAGDLGRAVFDRVMAPVVAVVGDAERVVIAPDGALNLVPFAALVDEKGKFLVERFELVLVTSGRDLLRIGQSSRSPGAPVLVADPEFGSAPDGMPVRSLVHEEGTVLGGANFPALPGTADEVERIAKLLPNAVVFTRERATEDAVKGVASPSLMHLATHGFFLRSAAPPASDARGLVHPASNGSLLDDDSAATFANPLLRSGLAFAQANRFSEPSGDGILTALEASGLDLFGTELVVLSACDTGVGDVRTGDGVYGLRRALVLAGAESQVLTLWPVDDLATRDLMVRYYKYLLKGRGRAEALRKVQLKMLEDAKYAHPYYWAGFIQSGAWAPLSH